jgi:uncharacterized membrane protein YgcG
MAIKLMYKICTPCTKIVTSFLNCIKTKAMKFKFLLFATVVLAITSCSTAYKSGQTPDDVYYSPAKFEENKDDDKEDRDDQVRQSAEDRRVRQTIRDRRWRDLDEYDYTFNNSPYNYCYCNCPNYGYYYNPYYNPFPIYSTTTVRNTTPRKINLNSYQGYITVKSNNNKLNNDYKVNSNNRATYNNSNRKESFGSKIVKIFTGNESNSSFNKSNNNSSGSNNTRSYTPSSSSSSSGSSGGGVSRPSRGGN